ncbi:hypothetical protein HYH02_007217 [Chlamydomonas schloesseri]|uniref:Uncharacterized protein n=1 Tax=Chlamydomonas schloesseri TaxID=2026947 RepID=A0A836B5C8_9CHLO|nr:hypothetical protein HYH02_007217 [Chlamydomonas schloesseri]|eukprot:KAG2447759.1 hypothetical protein HYH02_007217 [Chlamydomonas schloesseri]
MAIPLGQRAVHPLFLRRLAGERVPGSNQIFGDLSTTEVVQTYVVPATAAVKCSLAEALNDSRVAPKYDIPWVSPGGTILDGDGAVQKVLGPAKYFVSHAWNCRFSALVELLQQHYAAIPASRGGQRVLPIYYWIDIFAVSQHFTGDFHEHPDSDFPGVIRNCKSVLFIMHPWRAPVAPSRVWCLFEVLTAIQSPGVEVEMLLDVKDTRDTRVKTLTTISNSIDVRTAKATSMSDKNYLLGCIEQGLGFAAFNSAIRKRLKEALLQAVTPNAVEMGDTAALHELLKVGGCVRPDGIADLASCFRYASEADMLNIMRTIQLRDLRPRGLVLSGKQRTKEVTLSDGGLRGWDGASFSLREYNEVDTGRTQWAYLPAGPALCQAVGELLVPTVAEVNGTGSAGSSRGIEELWISLRKPSPDDNTFVAGPLLAATRGSPALSAAGSDPGTPRGPNSAAGSMTDGVEPGLPVTYRSDAASAPGLGASGRPGSALSPGAAPGSATAARAMARATVGVSPHRHRLKTSHSIGHTPSTPSRPSSGCGGVSPRMLYSPQTGQTGLTSTASLRGRSQMVLPVSGRPAGAMLGGSSSFRESSTSSPQLQQRDRPALPALTLAGVGSGTPSPRVSVGGSGLVGAPGMAGTLGSPSGATAGPRVSLSGCAAQPGLASALLAASSGGASPRASLGGHASAHGLATAMLGTSGGGAGGGGGSAPSPRMSLAGNQNPGGGVLASLALPSEPAQGGGVRPPSLAALSLGSGGPSPRVSLSGLSPTPPLQPQPPSQGYSSVSMASPRRRISTSGGPGGGGGGAAAGGSADPELLTEHVGSPVLPLESAAGMPLPPGRQALWAGVGASLWLRHLCLHNCVLGQEDLQNLAEALMLNDRLEVLQFVRCTAQAPEGGSAAATARLTGELLALGLSTDNLRQLHVRPGDPVYLETLPDCFASSSSDLRRVSLTPVALGPVAIRQLARVLSLLPELHSLTVGLDPAPFTTFMPTELCDREHWLVHEDKNEPDMALRRRRVMGLDEDGLAALVANAWDLKEDMAALPSAGRTPMATQQRAAGLGLCLALAAGWRDLGAYKRTYARWAWMRKGSVYEALAEMSSSFEAYRALVADALQFVPDSFAQRFSSARQNNKSKTRVQETYWELYGSQPLPAPAAPLERGD